MGPGTWKRLRSHFATVRNCGFSDEEIDAADLTPLYVKMTKDADGKAAASQSQSEGIDTPGSSDGEFEFDEATLALLDGKPVPSAPAVYQADLLPVAAGAGAGSSSHTPVDLSADSDSESIYCAY